LRRDFPALAFGPAGVARERRVHARVRGSVVPPAQPEPADARERRNIVQVQDRVIEAPPVSPISQGRAAPAK
jgi:hypothetical protein